MSLSQVEVFRARAEHGRGPVSLTLARNQHEWTAQEDAPGATVYHSWRFLSWIAPLLGCRFAPLLVQQQGRTVGLAPLLMRWRAGYQTANIVPFPFLGPVVPGELLAATAAVLRRWALRHGVLALQLELHPTAAGTNEALRAAGYASRSMPTHLVDLAGRSLDQVFASFCSDVRGAVRRSVRRGVTVRTSTAEELRTVLPAVHQEALGQPKGYAEAVGRSLASGRSPVAARCATALVDERPVGICVTVRGANAMGWLGGVYRADQNTQANSALTWDAIQWAHAEGCDWIDMGGSPDPGIAAYKRKFKPRIEEHPLATWQAPGFLAAQRLHQRLG
jgi:hypothetical protein